MTDVVIIEYFQSKNIVYYIIPVFIMFASTFKSTHWLVPGYCLGQISCVERSDGDDSPGTYAMVIAASRR